jgi:cytochrome c-type biogenesis protein
MMGAFASFAAAFVAGLVSFLSPCVLPLVPGYLSFLTGLSVRAEAEGTAGRTTVTAALLFVLGFTIVFVALGSTASLAGALLAPYRDFLARAAGVLLAAFGVLMLGVVRVPWLYGEARFDPSKARGLGGWAAPVVGAAFAFGWTPCVGPVLGSILGLAGSTADVARGAALLLVYSLGLGVPFVLAAVFLRSAGPVLRRLQAQALTVQRIAGSFLLVFGLAMAFGLLPQITGMLGRILPTGGL